jgi:hypothetical protein
MTAITTSDRSIPQHMAALGKANRTRLARAALKAQIFAGERTVADILRDIPPEAETMTVFRLLVAQDRWGRVRALRCLRQLGLPEGKQLRALTIRQREALDVELSPVVVAPAVVTVWCGRYSDRLHLVSDGRWDTACGKPIADWAERPATDWRCEETRCETCVTHARTNAWPVPDA